MSVKKEYGAGSLTASVAPVSGGNGSAGAATLYTFTNTCPKVTIQNHPDSGTNMHVLFNDVDTAVTAAIYDVVLTPGDQVASPDGIYVKYVGIHFVANATYGTDLTVRGWE